MAVLVLDTHSAIKRLVKAGQKEAEAEAIVELITDVHEQVATKADLAMLGQDLKVMEQAITLRIYTVAITIVGVLAAFKYWG